ncbi:hypothetical protein PHYSODRAFT_475058 [Phytophthora sojae]|uniref:Uncharacterized protein n=1 Tax=Phytophthora sojae (strain P6497) TaxID=1094619 RepID=G4YHW8_PHYSP|nr:hypothetical protein PHYSODRAFT_475058 [Phytophthora sojae]EGZ29695.1 hypothetical protein PHYSODRAFT_475058 [Phytophthora sojae]|eukprot:XP_009516970.1 hypothetical protein PHYSODRAFT_475058 [Phytophthora sojae]
MYQPSILPSNAQFSSASAAIEQFRLRQRQLCRGQQQQKQSNAGSLEVENGRTRKIPANWRRKQEQTTHSRYGYEDGNWPKAAGTEMYIGFNAFDFSSCPEALSDMEQQQPTSTTVGLMGVQGFQQPSSLTRPSSFDMQATRSAPEHYATYDERRRALYYQSQ